MAINLNSISPSPLDVLAAVASQTLRNEITVPENKIPSSIRKHVKKSTTSVLTFDDIKCMPTKLLIEKFSEMTSDELTKKYSYKCMLLPQRCTITFKSFGNEKKACDEMKLHLQQHVQQLITEYESNEEIPVLLFVQNSSNSSSRYSEKISRKSMKRQQIAINSELSGITSPKASKKAKNSTFSVKLSKKRLNDNKKYLPKFKNECTKIKEKSIGSTYLKKITNTNHFSEAVFFYKESKSFTNKSLKQEVPEESDQECDSEHYNNYSRHLKDAFFTDVELKEEISESHSTHYVTDLNDGDGSLEQVDDLPDETANVSSDKSFTFLQDHNYVCLENTKGDRKTIETTKSDKGSTDDDQVSSLESKKYEDPFLSLIGDELPPYVIKTPPFPFIHTPRLPEVAEITEIRMEDRNYAADKHSNSVNCLQIKNDVAEVLNDDCVPDREEKYDGGFFKVNGPSGSVLECVENIENKKHLNSCVPKNEVSSSENDENLENLQKDEKKLALDYIAKLHSKGKKKIPDSLICQICPDKHFTAQATLIHHYRSHAGIKPYACQICSSKFTRQHSLNYHMLIHQNLSRFTCEFCGRTFRHPSHYKEHLRRHTGETPYHCTDCNLHFKTRNTFKRHLKTRHGKLLTAGGIADLKTE